MRKQLYLISVLAWMLGLFFACSPSADKVDVLLVHAEECMEIHPDSALRLLKQIPHPDRLHRSQQADYALLLTQAQDKNYMDSLQSDSLIRIAVDYYQDGDDKVKAGKAFFYYGRVLSNQDKYTEAMAAYLSAQALLAESSEYKLQGLLAEDIGMLNYGQRMYDASILNFKKTVDCYKLAEDTLGIVYAYRNLARGYMMTESNDSARWYANEGLKLLPDIKHRVRSSLFQILGMIAEKSKDYETAIDFLKKALLNDPNTLSQYNYYISLGKVYLIMGRLDEAEQDFKNAIKGGKSYTQAGAYNYLFELEKVRGNYERAIFYKELSDSLLNIVHNENLQQQLLTLQKKYENEKLRMENEQIKLEKRSQFYLILLVAVLMVISVVAIRTKYRRSFQRNMDIIRKNQEEIKKYAFRIDGYNRKSEQEQLAKKKKIADLNAKILLLAAENKELRENTCIKASCILEQLNKGDLIVQRMTLEEKQSLFDFMDLIFANFISRLNANYTMTKTDLILSSLLKVGFTTKQLMFIFDCERNSVYRMKLRLKEHLCIDKEKSLEEFILFF